MCPEKSKGQSEGGCAWFISCWELWLKSSEPAHHEFPHQTSTGGSWTGLTYIQTKNAISDWSQWYFKWDGLDGWRDETLSATSKQTCENCCWGLVFPHCWPFADEEPLTRIYTNDKIFKIQIFTHSCCWKTKPTTGGRISFWWRFGSTGTQPLPIVQRL